MTADANDDKVYLGAAMRDYARRLRALARGISCADVRALLGAPDEVTLGVDGHGPSETFRTLGLHMEFGESDADEVWAYRDPYRSRRTIFVAFKSGHLCASWRDTLSARRPSP